MRETYAPVLLARKARRLRIESGNSMLRGKFETKGSQHIKMALKRPFKLLLTTPLVIIVALFVGIVYGILYLLISTFSFVYPDQYHFDEGTTGLSFLPAGLGMLIGVQAFGHIHDYLVRRARKGMGPDDEYRPEVKLNPWLIVPTGLTLPIGLLIYGWTAQYRIHWIVPMLGVVVFSAGLTGTTVSHEKSTAWLEADNVRDVHSKLSGRLISQIRRIRVGCHHAVPISSRRSDASGRVRHVSEAGPWLGQQPSGIHLPSLFPSSGSALLLWAQTSAEIRPCTLIYAAATTADGCNAFTVLSLPIG